MNYSEFTENLIEEIAESNGMTTAEFMETVPATPSPTWMRLAFEEPVRDEMIKWKRPATNSMADLLQITAPPLFVDSR